MPGQRCCVCGNSRANEPEVGFHRFPSAQKNPERRAVWLSVFGKTEDDVTPNSRVCSRHFPGGNVELSPVSTLGRRFASPIKKGVRAKRAKQRQEQRQLRELFKTPTPSSSKAATPVTSSRSVTPIISPPPTTPCIAMVGEQLSTEIGVHELPNEDGLPQSSTEVVVNTALLARIEALEQMVASFPSCPSNKYTLYTPALIDGVIVHRTWQYDGCLVFTSISCSLPEAQCV